MNIRFAGIRMACLPRDDVMAMPGTKPPWFRIREIMRMHSTPGTGTASRPRLRKFGRSRSRKVGLPPGSMVHVGEQKVEAVKLEVINYDEHHFERRELSTVDEALAFRDKPTISWLNVTGLHDPAVVKTLGEQYGIHALILEDILHTDQRPKVEFTDTSIYIVMRMLTYDAHTHEVTSEQISLFMVGTTVITFQERGGDDFDPLRQRLEKDIGKARRSGADYLAYTLMDIIVDHYFLVLESIGEEIESLERDVLENPDHRMVERIQRMKRELIFLRKATWPLREVISGLTRDESPLIHAGTIPYLRDVYDHIVQVIDMVETFRDMVSGLLDIYLSSVSNRMNEIMKVLTIIATIFIPLTFLVGVYGMNFKVMPELDWRWGYPLLWLVMITAIVSMLAFFRRKRWL